MRNYIKRPRQHGESDFQKAVVRFLRNQNIYCFSVPNANKVSYITGKYRRAEGTLSGVSDIIILLPRRAVFVEFKNPNGKGIQSDAQKDFQRNVEALGFEYLIWDSWAQVEAFLKEVKFKREI